MTAFLLSPADVLFFRDGRPMGGASSGHGSAWPLPNVVSHAFHAALHRAGFANVHAHRRGRSGRYEAQRDRKFGSLVTAGPFPAFSGSGPDQDSCSPWLFPRPLDAGASSVTLRPIGGWKKDGSSLPAPLRYGVGAQTPPSKAALPSWWSRRAWSDYLAGAAVSPDEAATDTEFADPEFRYGIGLSPQTGTVEASRFYSASYLRLRPGWNLGVLAQASDKDFRHPTHGSDLVAALLDGGLGTIVAGGQQRLCSVRRVESQDDVLPLPVGRGVGFGTRDGKSLVKWILLSPAIWPAIAAEPERGILASPGGWLPNWVAREERNFEGERVEPGAVLLLDGPGRSKALRRGLRCGNRIRARLVAALVPKAQVVTGWAVGGESPDDATKAGAKTTHLAVPAGAVYYFEADSPEDACKLAEALNWHGASAGTEIRHRRSTLLGEKGFGLGVCGTWEPHAG